MKAYQKIALSFMAAASLTACSNQPSGSKKQEQLFNVAGVNGGVKVYEGQTEKFYLYNWGTKFTDVTGNTVTTTPGMACIASQPPAR